MACPIPKPSDFAFRGRPRLVRSDHPDPATNEEAVAVLTISVKDPDEKKVGRAFSNADARSSPSRTSRASSASAGVRGRAVPSASTSRRRVPASATCRRRSWYVGGETLRPPSSVGDPATTEVSVDRHDRGRRRTCTVGRDDPRLPLGTRLSATRSGDKGGNANLGIFARSDEGWAWLDAFLTTEKLRELLPEVAGMPVDRHRLPAIRSLNFVIHGLLEEGVASSTRQDPQAKSLGEWLRARVVDLPEALAP